MNVRAATEIRDERSVTVADAAARLGCDPTTVRALLAKALLAGHRIGKTDRPNGVRVKLWSIEAWEARHAIGGTAETLAPKRTPRRRAQAADLEADAALKALGA